MAELAACVTLQQALARASSRLAGAGVEGPRLDAELLLAEVLGLDRGQLVLRAREALDVAVLERFDALLQRREAREPVAYILGRKPFRNIELAVDRRVLIPRPETELLVEVGLALPPGSRVADVGTGSGAVALALKSERPDLEVVGTDLSADAVSVARANAVRLGLEVQFLQGDLLAGVGQNFDAVLANLPYVATGSSELAAEIVLYEPAQALFAGPDGLAEISRLIAMLDAVALVGIEVAFDQAEAVGGLLAAAGYTAVERLRDLAGRERVVVGRR